MQAPEKYVQIVQKIDKIPVGLPVAPEISENLFHILNTMCLIYISFFFAICTGLSFVYHFNTLKTEEIFLKTIFVQNKLCLIDTLYNQK